MMNDANSQITDEPADDELHDVLEASASSTDFWDNPEDDEDWNNA